MPIRPYQHKNIDELERFLTDCRTDARALKRLLGELEHRSTHRAAKLRRNVSDAIALLKRDSLSGNVPKAKSGLIGIQTELPLGEASFGTEAPLPTHQSIYIGPGCDKGAVGVEVGPEKDRGAGMLDRSEQDRLGQLYEQLRIKLLDLTKRNRMLNFAVGSRSKRQLQIVDEVLEEVYSRLVNDDSFRIAHLEEPDSTPPEEKTEEFIDAFELAKVSDMEYLDALEELAVAGKDDESAVEKLERSLRDKVRSQLGFPPRPRRTDVNRSEHARSIGIDPSPELPRHSTKKSHSDHSLQTLKYPDELEAVMEKISDEARLAEQEAGLSTLFLAFGFLEWYESDEADRPYYAPLLLLPVKVERDKVRGKDVYEILAREGAAEINVSLQKFLEKEFSRALPDFTSIDSEDEGSVETYLSEAIASIEGLKRWKVRRWLMLGHFAFSRIAIYEDTKPERWQNHPASHPLVGSLLSGFEQGLDGDGPLFGTPEDYRIDDPEVERAAPLLIQDADASQHSALVDVMKSKNLVIQGPPGTGKSQTITNIIANSLAAGKTVLFLAEKQAALDVVKRRLDMAGVGDFCLELHSDRALPKAVVQSLARRFELGVGKAKRAGAPQVDSTWNFARAEITGYLDELHAEAEDGATPFELIWKSVRGHTLNADVSSQLKGTELPAHLLGDPAALGELRGKLEIYAASAQAFSNAYGYPAQSPWSVTPPGHVPAYDNERLLEAVSELRTTARGLSDFMDRQHELGIASSADAESALSADQVLEDPPDAATVASIATIDLDGLEDALSLQMETLAAASAVDELPSLNSLGQEAIDRIPAMAAALPDPALAEMAPAELRTHADQTIARYRSFVETVEALRPVTDLLGLGLDNPVHALDAIALAVLIAEKVEPQCRTWFGARHIDASAFERLHAEWSKISQEELDLRQALPAFPHEWPTESELDTAAVTLRKKGISKFVSTIRGEGKSSRELADRLGIPLSPCTPDSLERLSKHVRAQHMFMASPDAETLQEAWAGMSTPFMEIASGLRLRSFLERKLADLPEGTLIAQAVIDLPPENLAALAKHSASAASFLSRRAHFEKLLDESPTKTAVGRCLDGIASFERLIGIDQENELSATDLPLSRLKEIEAARTRLYSAKSAVDRSPFAAAVRTLAADDRGLAETKSALGWVRAVHAVNLPSPISLGLLSKHASDWRMRLREAATGYERAHDAFTHATGMLDEFGFSGLDAFDLHQLVGHLDLLLEHREELPEFISLKNARAGLEEAGLFDFLRKADVAEIEPERLPTLFDIIVAHLRADAARRASPSLAHRTGNELDAKRRTFAERDRHKIATDRAIVRARLLERRPPNGLRYGSVKTWTQMSLLANEFPKQRRFTPVRGLMKRAGEAIRTLKPCFMMSPLSLSKFLPAGDFEFDVLVIDEASQMKPEDALGAMLRAKQIVVVGDPKQLPPTSFFDRSSDQPATDDEDVEEIDDESILERCQKVFREVRRLKWHYRSRCESLIRFSNESFYDGSLITFPAAKPGSFSVDLLRVNGAYKARRNVAEAERVAQEAIEFMRHFAETDEEDLPTLGIVALNTDQRDLIQETLRRMSSDDEMVEIYKEKAEKRGEPIFVKNLENVQGDERDFIFISMTYGKESGASVMKQRFGPINSRQGHRRLNVLFSRARTRIGLFTSFGSVDVTPSETSREGVHVLKRYLEYAENKGRASVQRIGGEADSDFEIEVAERLERRGYTVDMQVGVSGFRIDLGVRHPDHPEMFLAGIECDGARYHSSKSARDRDRLREEVLRGLGWEIVRVWSTDWFDNPDGQTEKLAKRLEELREKTLSAFHDYRLKASYAPGSETGNEAKTETEADRHPEDSVPDANPVSPSPVSNVREEEHDGIELLNGVGGLSTSEAYAALVALRETVIRPEASIWEPHRSILRDAMIETFVRQRIADPDDWFNLIPHYLRSGTDPVEKRRYLDRICSVVERIDREGLIEPRVNKETPATDTTQPHVRKSSQEKPQTHIRQYSHADFNQAGLKPNRDHFYDPQYRTTLRKMVAHLIEAEGPIYGDILAMRIARAHGMERTGATIQRIVFDAIERRFPRTREEERDVFWPEGSPTDRLVAYRPSDGSRSHADTPLAELASLALPFLGVGLADEVIVARLAEHFGLERIRAATRARFEVAIKIARTATQ